MSDKNSFKIRFLHWNVLRAECCTPGEFPYVEERARDWYHRFALFQHFLREHPVDLLYLTEVDKYQDFFAPLLVELKYRVFVEYQHDIVAYRSDALVIPRKEKIVFEVGRQYYIRIDIIPSIVLFCVHLENELGLTDTRMLQVQQLLKDAGSISNESTIILMGCFNDDSIIESIQLILKEKYEWLNDHMLFTFFKRREILERGVKDYVFVRHGSPSFMKKESSVTTYEDALLAKIDLTAGLPNEFIPSCNLPLVSELFFKARILSFS